MIKELIHDTEKRMRSSIQSLEDDLAAVRTGRANPGLIEKLSVEYYGSPVPLMQLASISVPEPRQLLVRPFDSSSIKNIEKAIQSSELGLTPINDGKVIRRRDLIKFVNNRLEEARVAVRNIRRDAIKDLRDFQEEKMISEDDQKRGEEDIQKLTDRIGEEINEIGKNKEHEIMEI